MKDLNELVNELKSLQQSGDWQAILNLFSTTDLTPYRGNELHPIIRAFLTAAVKVQNYPAYQEVARHVSRTYVNEAMIMESNALLNSIRGEKSIIATFDPERLPGSGEVVICYGDYPHKPDNLPCSNHVQRHLKYFWDLKHDLVEHDSIWDPIDKIYIVNMDHQFDRYIETLRELCRMRAPFNKVHRLSAIKVDFSEDSRLNGHIGCAKSHLAIIEDALSNGYSNVLVLEDDFCFTSNLDDHRNDLNTFFERAYDYDVCLLATSNFFLIEELDDLLSYSYQECTTTSGYLVSATGQSKLLEIWSQALKRMMETQDHVNNACDRSWSSLQNDKKFFVFKRKMGFQRPGYSVITGKTSFYMD